MTKGLKNVLLAVVLAVVLCLRLMGQTNVFDIGFYTGCFVMAGIEGLYLFVNRKVLDETERVNELFYLCGIGVVLACKIFVF